MTPAGLRSLFRHHRLRSHVPQANAHRLRQYAPSRTMPPHGVSRLPAGLWPRIMRHSFRFVVGILGE
jgi:hypothetical protein